VGTSVLELVTLFEKVSGVEIPHQVVDRRPGDVAELVASPGLARTELGWTARRDVEAMCRDSWAFQSKHPQGIT
jgi:UDP-glucose 4-epimerase